MKEISFLNFGLSPTVSATWCVEPNQMKNFILSNKEKVSPGQEDQE